MTDNAVNPYTNVDLQKERKKTVFDYFFSYLSIFKFLRIVICISIYYGIGRTNVENPAIHMQELSSGFLILGVMT